LLTQLVLFNKSTRSDTHHTHCSAGTISIHSTQTAK
jgi:hypothetical protein